jgi:hypothetical protein
VYLGSEHAEKMAGNANVTIKCSNDRQLEINTKYIGEGSFRRAFMGRVVQGDFQEKGGFAPGDPVVIKMIRRDKFNTGSRHVFADVETQRLAKRLVEAFVREVQPRTRDGRPVRVTMCSTNLITLKESVNCGTFSSVRGEQVAIEKVVPGNFEKFNSNSGWSAEQHNLPDALSHWTWVHTQGQCLLCDLQGHRGDAHYVFTDPAILSTSETYGDTDLGHQGICNWFAAHECNSYCRHLGIDRKRPDNPGHFFARRRGTTYSIPTMYSTVQSYNPAVNTIRCRYGSACTRRDCYYTHP